MNILLVDSESKAFQEKEDVVTAAVPTAQCFSFQSSQEALKFVETTHIDIAFLDIDMRFMPLFLQGIFSAKALTNICPSCNIIFCIDQEEYAGVLSGIEKSTHMVKPITPEKVQAALAQFG